MTVAFVFQGGASLAAAQVGMLRALVEEGIRPDLVVGSSAGAINAVAYAQDPTSEGLNRLLTLWTGIRRRDVFPVRLRSIAAGLMGREPALVTSNGLRHLVEQGLDVPQLQDTVIPAHVVATDAHSGEPVVLSEGPAVQAVLASAAIPGVLTPVRWQGRQLVDGSVCADIPILQAEALGATVSYVLPSIASAEEPAPVSCGALPAVLRTMSLMMGRITMGNMSAARGQVHLLPAPVVAGPNPMDFSRTADHIRLGLASTRRWLADRPHELTLVPACGSRTLAPDSLDRKLLWAVTQGRGQERPSICSIEALKRLR